MAGMGCRLRAMELAVLSPGLHHVVIDNNEGIDYIIAA
jgi:hypothetical protein